MRTFILFTLYLLFSNLPAFGQKDGFFVGLQGSALRTKYDYVDSFNGTSSSWSVAPYVGTFINKNIAVGAAGRWSKYASNQKNFLGANSGGEKTRSLEFLVFGRYYMPLSGRWSLFGELTFNAGRIRREYFDGNTSPFRNSESFAYGPKANIGSSLLLGKKVSLVAHIYIGGYTRYNDKENDEDSSSISTLEFGLDNIGKAISMGVYYDL